jgi:hypothetical protein
MQLNEEITIDTINELKEFKPLAEALNNYKSPKTGLNWFPNQELNESLAKQFAQLYPCFISAGISNGKFEIVNVFVPSKDKNYHPLILFNSKYYSEYGTCIDKSDYDSTVEEFLKFRQRENNGEEFNEDDTKAYNTANKKLSNIHDSLVKNKTAKCKNPCL